MKSTDHKTVPFWRVVLMMVITLAAIVAGYYAGAGTTSQRVRACAVLVCAVGLMAVTVGKEGAT
jgi:uncharacterized membrane protein